MSEFTIRVVKVMLRSRERLGVKARAFAPGNPREIGNHGFVQRVRGELPGGIFSHGGDLEKLACRRLPLRKIPRGIQRDFQKNQTDWLAASAS